MLGTHQGRRSAPRYRKRMKKHIVILLLVVAMIVFVGCATDTYRYRKVEDLGKPITVPGSSILPPAGNNWQYRLSQELGVEFGKRGDGFHTYGATVTLSPVRRNHKDANDFLLSVKNQFYYDTDPKRFEGVQLSGELNNRFGAFCVRYVAHANDLEASRRTGANIIFKIIGYSFLHPDSKGLIVTVAYHERAEVDGFSKDFIEVGESFIDGYKPKEFNPDILLDYFYLIVEAGAFYAAEVVVREALEKYQQNENELGMAEAYHTLGNFYKLFQNSDADLDKSLDNFTKSRDLFSSNRELIGVSKCYFGIGNVYHIKGNKANACTYYDKSIETYKEAKRLNSDAYMPVRVPPYDFVKLVDLFKQQVGCEDSG